MNKSDEVDAWFEGYDNPMKEVVQKVREIILDTDERITECIKWKSPTFVFKGNIASFNPRSKKHASLMFHTGATIPGAHPILEGGGETARYIKFDSLGDVSDKTEALRDVLRAWIELKS